MSETNKNRGPSAGPENRRALIAAAREIFATAGYKAPLNSVARLAGVGQGSLYRHFPDRTALAIAVFDENLNAVDALAAEPDTDLDQLMSILVGQAVVSTSFIEMVTDNLHDERVLHLRERMDSIAERVLAHERGTGRVGDHVETGDVLLAISMLAGVIGHTEPEDREAVAARAWALFRRAFAPS